MKNNSIRKMAMNGLMIALVFLATYFTRIPTPLPGGYFNLGDAVIMFAAVFLGPLGGLIAGGIGSCFADLAAGALIFAPITLVVKGIEGLVVGLLAAGLVKGRENNTAFGKADGDAAGYQAANGQKPEGREAGRLNNARLVLSLAVGAAIIVAGYFTGEAFVLSLFDKTFGIAAAAGELIPNLVQGVLSAVIAWFLTILLSKGNLQKYI